MSNSRNSNSRKEGCKSHDENNFYDVCIQAIESNNDIILNKKECIKGINKLKFRSISNRNLLNKQKTKKIDKKIPPAKIFTQKSIDELLEESKNKFEIINKRIDKKTHKSPNDENNEPKENENNFEHDKPNFRKDKKFNQFFKGKQRRYTVLKHINEYLESNDVTINELIDNNPFQDKAYHIARSYEFIDAVKFGNFDYVNEALTKDGKYLFVIDYYGQTGYHWAAKLGNIKMLDLLIKYGRHQNQKDFKGRTPLYLAAVNNNLETCLFLLSNGANPFLSDKEGKTPADAAGNIKISEFLKENMAQPFSNPVYKAKMKKILHDRANHIFKEEQKEDKKSTKNLDIVSEEKD